MKNQKIAQYAFLTVISICTLFIFKADVPSNSRRMLRSDLSSATAMQLHKKFLDLVPKNQAPIIGIITQGTTDMAYYDDYTMIASSYIKYIESAGGKVVAVPYNLDEEALGRIYENINGLLIPGGRMKLVLPTTDTKDSEDPKMQMSMLARAVKYFVNRSVEDFERGVYFPIFGICLGQEAIALALNQDDLKTMTLLDLEANTYIGSAGSSTKESRQKMKDSRLFNSFTDEEIKAFEEKARFYYHHKYGITEETQKKSEILSKYMIPLTTLEDKQSRKYITAFEISNYPLFGVQFHPEKTSFEWHITTDRSFEAVIATHKLGYNFVNECRKNSHVVSDRALIKSLGVYNHMIMGPKNGYSQLFYFSKDKMNEAFEAQDMRQMLV